MIEKLTKTNLYLALALLIYVPFHAILSIWASSIFGHYTLARLFEEYILGVMLLIGIYLFIKDFKDQKKLFKDKLIILMVSYLALILIYSKVGYMSGTVNLKASLYGILLDTRYLIYFLLVYQTIYLFNKLNLKNKIDISKLIMIPAFIVIAFGLLQVFVLPYNFLSHFGYSKDTILPYQTVNNNLKYIRIMSTLRGSNPLGAYLIFPISFLFIRLLNNKKDYKNYIYILASLVVLYFSYCRSAVLGLIFSIAAIYYLNIKNNKMKRVFELCSVLVVIVSSLSFVAFRNNSYFQNIVFHTQKNSAVKSTSDQGHSSALLSGIKEVIRHPLGNGVGYAGQASIYNYRPAVISENYFLQIGEETGVIGLLLFIAIIILILFRLYKNKSDDFSKLMFGLTLAMITVCMLWFALSDETLCFIFFGLLAVTLSKKRINLIKE